MLEVFCTLKRIHLYCGACMAIDLKHERVLEARFGRSESETTTTCKEFRTTHSIYKSLMLEP